MEPVGGVGDDVRGGVGAGHRGLEVQTVDGGQAGGSGGTDTGVVGQLNHAGHRVTFGQIVDGTDGEGTMVTGGGGQHDMDLTGGDGLRAGGCRVGEIGEHPPDGGQSGQGHGPCQHQPLRGSALARMQSNCHGCPFLMKHCQFHCQMIENDASSESRRSLTTNVA